MSRRFLPEKDQNSFNSFWEENIKKERKGNLISLIQAIDGNEIPLKNATEKYNLINNLKSSLEKLSLSPKMKIQYLGEHSLRDSRRSDKIKTKIADPDHELVFGKGKRHFQKHPNMNDNVKFEYKSQFQTPNERIEDLVKYYASMGEQERNYNYSPEMHSFYKKGQVDPMLRYSSRVRHMNISPDSPSYVDKSDQPEVYYVMKFNNRDRSMDNIKSSEKVKQNLIKNIKNTQNESKKIKNPVNSHRLRGVYKNIQNSGMITNKPNQNLNNLRISIK